MATPKTFYKYRSFDARAVHQLCADSVFYANPQAFNDPLDCKPTVEADLEAPALEDILANMVRLRVAAEKEAAAKMINYRGPKTIEQISRLSEHAVRRILEELQYHATDPFSSVPPPLAHKRLLAHEIEQELLRRYDRGVYSLASRWQCPLMWSHYGDQHRGICIGYKMREHLTVDIRKVSYGGSRQVRASDVAAMMSGDPAARARVDAAMLLTKAVDWRYEKEWRLFGPSAHLSPSPLRLTEVTFGLRCPDAVKHTVAQALRERSPAVRFYEIAAVPGKFKLTRSSANLDELAASYARGAISAQEDFASLE